MPHVDLVLLISRWLHLMAAIVAIGGVVFSRVALRPEAAALDNAARDRLTEGVRRRWSRIVYVCIAVLLLTGGLNFALLAIPPRIDPIPYHPVFGIKLLAALTIFFIASALVGRSPGLERLRSNAARWQTVILVLAALIVLLSGILNQVRTNQRPHNVMETTSAAG